MRNETYLIGTMRGRTIKPLNTRDAHAYVADHLGRDLTPKLGTWMSWMRPGGRTRFGAVIRERCVPQPVRVPGVRSSLFRVEDLDRFIARTLELLRRPPTPAT